MRSKVIRENLEIQGIVPFTRARRRFWRDHVDKMTEGRWEKWAKDEKPNSRCSPGQPPNDARAVHLLSKRPNGIKEDRRNKAKS
ncbi:hypothetical protein Trydic_g1359 [Trypoxylus dichotomus]